MGKMTRLGLFAFFFSLLATQSRLKLVSGDIQLINQLCQNTQSPNFCRDCLINLNPGSQTKTAKQLAGLALGCAENVVVALRLDFINCEANGPGIAFKVDCSICEGHIAKALRDLATARQTYNIGRFQQAADVVDQALSEYTQCTKVLGVRLLPQPLASDLQKFEGYSKSAAGVFRQIH